MLRETGLTQPPSPFLKKLSSSIVESVPGLILDVPSGRGRNALLLRKFGRKVVCVDNAPHVLQAIVQIESFVQRSDNQLPTSRKPVKRGKLFPLSLDLRRKQWPFLPHVFAGIVNVHFVCPWMFNDFLVSLKPGGYLLCETFGGQGMNYIDLPEKGAWKELLQDRMEFEYYKEHSVGPPGGKVVTVKFLGRKR